MKSEEYEDKVQQLEEFLEDIVHSSQCVTPSNVIVVQGITNRENEQTLHQTLSTMETVFVQSVKGSWKSGNSFVVVLKSTEAAMEARALLSSTVICRDIAFGQVCTSFNTFKIVSVLEKLSSYFV